MAAVPLFRGIIMAAVASHENTLQILLSNLQTNLSNTYMDVNC